MDISEKISLLNECTLDSLNENLRAKIIENFTETGIKILHADFGFTFWNNPDNKKFNLGYVSPRTPYEPQAPRPRGYNYLVGKTKQPYMGTLKKEKDPKYDLTQYMKSIVILPIYHKDSSYGNIVLGFKSKRKFTKEDQGLCVALGNSAAQALTIHQLMRQKDEFISTASHELRTPITTLKGFAQLLEKQVGKSDGKFSYFISRINTQVDKLGRLVGDLLDVSRIDQGKLNFNKEYIDINELIGEVIEDARFSSTDYEIILKGKITEKILADRDRLNQVFTNILSNAIKYSPENKKIIIEMNQLKSDVEIMIQDFGIGISRDEQKRVFDKFFQSHYAVNDPSPSLGLGLFITRQIVERHDGKIWVTSVEGKGTKFYIKLPIHDHKR